MEKKIKATEAPGMDWKKEAERLEAAINAIPIASFEAEKELSPEIQTFKIRLQQLLFGNLIKFPKNNEFRLSENNLLINWILTR